MPNEVIQLLTSRGAKTFGFHESYPDALIYNNGEKTVKVTIGGDKLLEFIQFLVKHPEIGETVDQGVAKWYTPKPGYEEDFFEHLHKASLEPVSNQAVSDENFNQPHQPEVQTSLHPAEQFSQTQAATLATAVATPPALQSANNPQQNEQDDDNSAPESFSDEDLVTHLLSSVNSYMVNKTSNVSITLDSNCNISDGGKIEQRPNLSSQHIQALHRSYKTKDSGDGIRVTVDGNNYVIRTKTIGTNIIADFSREISYSDYTLPATRELEYALGNIGTGFLLVVSNHPILKLEPALKMIEDVDATASLNTVLVGNALSSHSDLPTIDGSEPQWTKLRESHYRYVIIDSKANHNMVEILSLIQNGKIVILGFDTSSAYSSLTKLESEVQHLPNLRQSILMSTIGILHPVIKKDTQTQELSLTETQFYLMTFSRVQELLEGQLSIEAFNQRLESPAKVYNLMRDSRSFSQEYEWQELLRNAVSLKASDIFIVPGSDIKARINGNVTTLVKDNRILPPVTKQLMFILTTQSERELFKKVGHLDSIYSMRELGRFRLSFDMQRDSIAIMVRPVQFGIPSRTDMRIPPEIIEVVKNNPQGIVLTTGAMGQGKSTTNAILFDEVMNSGKYVGVSIGDPCEYFYQHGNGIVIQREIPTDTPNHETALNSIFRSNADVIEVGELRSQESVSAALRLGSSGHLLLSTMHTSSIISTIDAVLQRSDAKRKDEVLESLAQNLLVIINQRLLKDVNGERYPLFEYLILDHAARVYISRGDFNGLESHIKSSSESNRRGVARTMQHELETAYELGLISEVEYKRVSDSITPEDGDMQ